MDRISSFRWAAGMALMLSAGVAGSVWAACTPGVNPMGIDLTQVVEPPGGFVAGGVVEITLRATAACTETYTEPDTLEIVQTPPPGWSFDEVVSVSEGEPPGRLPAPNDNAFTFFWDTPVALPVTLTYRLYVPEEAQEAVQLVGQAFYQADGEEYESPAVVVVLEPLSRKPYLCCGVAAPDGRRGDWEILLATALALIGSRYRPRRVYGTGLRYNLGRMRMKQRGMNMSLARCRLRILPVVILAAGLAAVCGTAQSELTPPVGDPGTYNPLGLTVSHGLPSGYEAGAPVEILVEISLGVADGPAITALALIEEIPPGWSFTSMGEFLSGGLPSITPTAGEQGELEFVWITIPNTFPYQFTYILTPAGDQTEPQTLWGQTLYRTTNEELLSDIAALTLDLSADNEPPVIVLSGGDIVVIEQGDPYVDPGYVATDDVDGDISDQVEVEGVVDTNTIGEYTLTYTVADAAGNPAAPVTRTVKVVKPQLTLKELLCCGPSVREEHSGAADLLVVLLAGVLLIGGAGWTARRRAARRQDVNK